jgi:hypothetical protein
MTRLWASLSVALTGSALLWAALATNGIAVIGYELGYLDGGAWPMTPSVPVTLSSLVWLSMPLAVLFGIASLLISLIGYRRTVWPLLGLLWLVAGYLGGSLLASQIEVDFGATWAGTQAFRSLFFRTHISVPLALAGVMTLALLARWLLQSPTIRTD